MFILLYFNRIVAMYMKHVKKLFGIEMEVRGEDNLKSAQPCIIVCNHQSSVDLMGKSILSVSHITDIVNIVPNGSRMA